MSRVLFGFFILRHPDRYWDRKTKKNLIKKTNKNKITYKIKIMMTIKNRVQLVGNLGTTPQVKTTESGNKVGRFSVATSEQYYNKKGEKISETHWHNVVVWGKLAEIAQQLMEKGTEVAIDGKLSTRHYTDKTGTKRYITEVVASELLLVNKNAKAA
jgi:single-strand DNA-binding protein